MSEASPGAVLTRSSVDDGGWSCTRSGSEAGGRPSASESVCSGVGDGASPHSRSSALSPTAVRRSGPAAPPQKATALTAAPSAAAKRDGAHAAAVASVPTATPPPPSPVASFAPSPLKATAHVVSLPPVSRSCGPSAGLPRRSHSLSFAASSPWWLTVTRRPGSAAGLNASRSGGPDAFASHVAWKTSSGEISPESARCSFHTKRLPSPATLASTSVPARNARSCGLCEWPRSSPIASLWRWITRMRPPRMPYAV